MASPDRLMTVGEVGSLTGLPVSSIYELIRAPRVPQSAFPRPIKLGPRRSRWSEIDVLNWVERQKRAKQERARHRAVRQEYSLAEAYYL
eukprot:gene52878-70697_t